MMTKRPKTDSKLLESCEYYYYELEERVEEAEQKIKELEEEIKKYKKLLAQSQPGIGGRM